MDENLDSLGLEFPTIKLVNIEVGEFKVQAMRMYDMPYPWIQEVTSQEPGPELLDTMVNMFKLAVVQQDKVPTIETLTYDEVATIINQWSTKSAAHVRAAEPAQQQEETIPEDAQQMLADLMKVLNKKSKRRRPFGRRTK